MSVAGRAGDAAAAAGRYRAHTDQTFAKPAPMPGGDDKLCQQAILVPIKLDEQDYQDAQLHVRRLANRHGCRPETDPGNCPNPAAHLADVAALREAFAPLFGTVRPRTGKGWR